MDAIVDKPKYQQVVDIIEQFINDGTLPQGARLPSVRQMSKNTGYSMTTVLQAYRHLEDCGIISAKAKSGFFVHHQKLPEPLPQEQPGSAHSVSISELVTRVMNAGADNTCIPLGLAVPTPDLLPSAALAIHASRTLKRAPLEANAYSLPQGDLTLRQGIARRALQSGSRIRADDIIITCGGTEALNLSLRALCRRGDTVAVDSPTYFGILQILESLELYALEIPSYASTGMDLNALENALGQQRIAACLTSSGILNPMGGIMPDDNKIRLLNLLYRYQVPLIDDDVYGDLYFGISRPRSFSSFDSGVQIVTCGSFSKVLAPGYRVGWVTSSGDVKKEIVRTKFAQSLCTPTITQLVVANYLNYGHFDLHLRRLRRVFQRNLDLAQKGIKEYFPEDIRCSRPKGGFVLWLELAQDTNTAELHNRALQHNISIAPGTIFSATTHYNHCMRLSFGHSWSERTLGALKTLSILMRSIP